ISIRLFTCFLHTPSCTVIFPLSLHDALPIYGREKPVAKPSGKQSTCCPKSARQSPAFCLPSSPNLTYLVSPEQKGTHDERPSRDPATYHRTPSPIRSVLWTHLEWNRVCRDRYRGELWNDPIRDRIDHCGTHRRDLRDVRHRTGIRSALSG